MIFDKALAEEKDLLMIAMSLHDVINELILQDENTIKNLDIIREQLKKWISIK